MLIEFRVKNYRSIRDLQVLSTVASKREEHPNNVFSTEYGLKLVRSAAIYGPNASGKSNIIRGLHFMRYMVLKSYQDSQQGEKIPVESFLFDQETQKQPSMFEVTFIKDKVKYQYGFALNQDKICEEWLYDYPNKKQRILIERIYVDNKRKYEWRNPSLSGHKNEKDLWESTTRNNSLFLSTAIGLNNLQLLPVFNWFREELIILNNQESHFNRNLSIDKIDDNDEKRKIMPYLNIADPSILDVLVEFKKPTESLDHLAEKIKEKFMDMKVPYIKFIHPNNTTLKPGDESQGTKKILMLSGFWLEMLENRRVVVIDELDNSLHPLLVKFLIREVYNVDRTKENSQLIFSTHNTSLLNNDIFRRDQIWFIEKDKNHATQLYSLIDFKPRKKEAIEKGYLQGRYGSVPYINDWDA